MGTCSSAEVQGGGANAPNSEFTLPLHSHPSLRKMTANAGSNRSLSSASSNAYSPSPQGLRHMLREKSGRKLMAFERAKLLEWTERERATYWGLEDRCQASARDAQQCKTDVNQLSLIFRLQCEIFDEQIAICEQVLSRCDLLKS